MYWRNDNEETDFSDLEGKTLESVEVEDEEIRFQCADGTTYRQIHYQDCCERVTVEDITGDIHALEGSEIIEASERTEDGDGGGYGTSTWTFYHLRSHAGDVTIRWYGTSNGYYSERVTFERVVEEGDNE